MPPKKLSVSQQIKKAKAQQLENSDDEIIVADEEILVETKQQHEKRITEKNKKTEEKAKKLDIINNEIKDIKEQINKISIKDFVEQTKTKDEPKAEQPPPVKEQKKTVQQIQYENLLKNVIKY